MIDNPGFTYEEYRAKADRYNEVVADLKMSNIELRKKQLRPKIGEAPAFGSALLHIRANAATEEAGPVSGSRGKFGE